MPQRRLIVEAEVGLHARPAATFVQIATKSAASVTLAKGDGAPVNAKSILSVLALDVKKGDAITISTDGEGADELLEELVAIAGAP
ncbi:HPr family phosphocarrier protein [Herbidospora cretacea]|uniref:HPr family phosphocarrier protein n=1 Tax=Herbidospora cretacea TaxID=28444 RepID=UPI0007741EC9|nr:HPr family phosphocarrier protein [Herbidospora cretacea]